MRILFTADIHGSTILWEKAVYHGRKERIDLLIIAGDLAGKNLLPIVKSNSHYVSNQNDKEVILNSEQEVLAFQEFHQKSGIYSKVMNKDEFDECRNNKNYLEKLFSAAINEHLEKMFSFIENSDIIRITKVVVSPGNDDTFSIDEKFNRRDSQIFFGGDGILNIDGTSIINFSYVPPSPWKTYRELKENDLYYKLKTIIRNNKLKEKVIFNVHCPPYGTKIDQAPKLKDLKPVIEAGEIVYINIGSRSIKKLIEEQQPICSFHGHVHESPGKIRIGKTFCFNPGSEYEKGIFRAYLVITDNDAVVESNLIID